MAVVLLSSVQSSWFFLCSRDRRDRPRPFRPKKTNDHEKNKSSLSCSYVCFENDSTRTTPPKTTKKTPIPKEIASVEIDVVNFTHTLALFLFLLRKWIGRRLQQRHPPRCFRLVKRTPTKQRRRGQSTNSSSSLVCFVFFWAEVGGGEGLFPASKKSNLFQISAGEARLFFD